LAHAVNVLKIVRLPAVNQKVPT